MPPAVQIDTRQRPPPRSFSSFAAAATGARIVAAAAKDLKERGGGRCLVSICTAGGMGVVAILER